MHSPVEMVQLDDVENAAKLIAAFAQKLERRALVPRAERRAPPALGHRRHAAAACHGASTPPRCARRPRRVHGVDARRRCEVEAAGRTDAAIARDLLRRRGRRATTRSTRAPTRSRARPWPRTSELCPPDLSRYVAPGVPEALDALAADPERYRLALVTGNLEPVARRKLASAGIGALLRAPARAASARTPRSARELPAVARAARRRLAARAHRRDRRHAARHRLRARRRRARDRGRHRARSPPRRWPTRTPSWTASAPRCRCWRTSLRADHLRRAAAAADRLRRGEHAAPPGGNSIPVAAPISPFVGGVSAGVTNACPNARRQPCPRTASR